MFKSTSKWPPGGWQYKEPVSGWAAPNGLTFDGLVRKVIEHRLGNPRYGLSTEWEAVSWDIQLQNAQRIHFHPDYWDADLAKKKLKVSPLPPVSRAKSGLFASLAKLVRSIKQTSDGARILTDWLGDGAMPVCPEKAQARANVCETCPKNKPSEGYSRLTAEVAQAIKEQVEVKNKLNLKLSNEDTLGTCEACGCHLGLKPWVPLPYLEQTLDEEDEKELDPRCWVRKEKAERLLCVIPFCKHDYNLAKKLIEWIVELGGVSKHQCLLVVDCKVTFQQMEAMKALAERAFAGVEAITTPYSLPNESWPAGPNWMFETALRHIKQHYAAPFFWCEPDCVPLKPTWLDELESEYHACGTLFMGSIVHSSGQPNVPGDHLTGVAVYPHNAHDYLQGIYQGKEAFDMAMAPIVVPHTHHTNLHYHFWGQMKLPPTFKGNERNTLQMQKIPAEAVTYHRCKDGSLIDLLRANLQPA